MIKMKKLIASGLFCGALLMSSTVGAFAAGPSMPGTPGDANCQGQTTAFLAQLAKNNEFFPDEFRGLGGVSRATGLSVQEIRQIAVDFCNEQP